MKDRLQPWPHAKMLYSIEEAAKILSLSRAQLYRLIEVKELPTVKIGKCRRITYAQMELFVQMLEQTEGWVRL